MDGSGPRFVNAPEPDRPAWNGLAPSSETATTGQVAPPPPPVEGPRTPLQRAVRWIAIAVIAATLGLLGGLALQLGDGGPRSLARDESTLAVWTADEGELVELAYVRDGRRLATDEELHAELWAEWSELIPPYWSRRVTRFEIASDGPAGVAAAVQRLDDEGDRWLLAVDPVDAVENPDTYLQTLVHELAHIVTLGDGRVVVDRRPAGTLVEQAGRCDGPPTSEGCAAAGSFIAAFSERFWDLDRIAGPDGVATTGDREPATIERYLAARDDYVSAYAASSPGEDIAESFVALAFDLPQAPGSVAARKVAFLRADAELFAVADRIREVLRDR